MKIALFVGSGSISSSLVNLISKLNGLNHEIAIFSRTQYFNISCGYYYLENFCDINTYQRFLKSFKPNLIYSSIWCHTFEDYTNSGLNDIYAASTLNLFNFAQDLKVSRFVSIGSSAEYDSSNLTNYSQAKSNLLLKLNQSNTSNMQITWLRPFYVYGKNQPKFTLINQIADSIANKSILSLRHPYKLMDFITSRDVAEGILTAIFEELSGIYDLGTGQLISLYDFIGKVFELLNLSQQQYIQYQSHEETGQHFKADISSQLHQKWKPKDSLDSGIRWCLES